MTPGPDSPRRAVFVDKDDTVVRDVPYSACVDLVEWMPGAVEGLRTLAAAGFELVLVTNQSGVARGAYSERDLERYLAGLRGRLAAHGVALRSVEYCPHHPDAPRRRYRRVCSCRKPNPGMLVRAGRRLGVDMRASWMVGDLLDDVEAGRRAGCRTALLAVHDDQTPPERGIRHPDLVCSSLAQAAEVIAAGSRAVA